MNPQTNSNANRKLAARARRRRLAVGACVVLLAFIACIPTFVNRLTADKGRFSRAARSPIDARRFLNARRPPPPPVAPEWQPTQEQQAFFDTLSQLAADERVAAVTDQLGHFNPGSRVEVEHQFADGQVVSLSVHDAHPANALTEIWPIMGLPGLRRLDLSGTLVSDLTPISRLSQLESLNCSRTDVQTLAPLASCRSLREVDCRMCDVTDLSPLAGLQLTWLSVRDTQVCDLSPLQGMPLDTLDCSGTRIVDLWAAYSLPLVELNISHTRVSDLSPLQGLPLTTLTCADARSLVDISPLKGMSLKIFDSYGNDGIQDYSALMGMPLEAVRCMLIPDRDAEFIKYLKSLESLERIDERPVAEFWKDFEPR